MTSYSTPQTNRAERNQYYYSNGQRILLVPEPRVFAVRYHDGRNSRDPQLTRRAFRLLQEESENIGFIPNYDLQIYQTNLPATERRRTAIPKEEDVFTEVKHLNTEAPIKNAAMAYRCNPQVAASRVEDLMFVTREFVVQFKPDISREEIDAFNAQHGVRVVKTLDYAENGYLLEAPEAEGENGPIVLANLYYESGVVKFAHPNFVRRRHLRAMVLTEGNETLAKPNMQLLERQSSDRSQYLAQQWHLQTAKVVDAWNITRGKRAIKVAILDDGVDVGHPEFAGKVAAQYDFATGNSDGNPNSSYDSHGTACAGVAIAQGVKAPGAAPNCSLIAVRYPDFLGVVEEAEMFRWTVDKDADVISCSWGPADGTGAVDPLPDNVRAAIRYCATQGRNGLGIPIFWAAGNGNESVSNDGYAANSDVMAIAASSSRERRSWYSDYGPEVFICAPSSGDGNLGERRILTVDRRGTDGYNPDPDTGAANPPGDYNYTSDFGGTSSATPLVAGIAGLMLSVNPNLRRQDIQQILRETADKIDPTHGNYDSQGHSQLYGYGRVNALRAVERARDFGGNSSGQPAISAPGTINRNDLPPTFQISTGGRQFYAVEVATRSELFNSATYGSDRSPNNFYGSWEAGLSRETPYTLPTTVWNRLKQGQQLFYRLHVADTSSWENYAVTVRDSAYQEAPSITIRATSSPESSSPNPLFISAPSTVTREDAPPRLQIQTGGRRLYAVELAARSELFNSATYGSDRTPNNFYGSWEDRLLSQTPYTLPTTIWQQLKHHERLFYRLHVADTNSWDNYAVTISDSQANFAPSFQIVHSNGTGGGMSSGARIITFPSGATFNLVNSPTDGVDYSDPVGNGAVPLIEVRGRREENLTRNFKVKELAARDRAKFARISVDLVTGLQRIRDRLGAAITVNSGYRHPALNAEVDGVDQSQHIAGRAADIRTSAMRPLELAQIALEELGCDIGIGLGRNGIHVDLRGQLASWGYEGAELTEREFDQWVGNTCQQLSKWRSLRREFADRVVPTITGPEQYHKRNEAPTFYLHPGLNAYFAVEVATHPRLFLGQEQGQRQADNFYGSWATESLLEAKGATIYKLPETVWQHLRWAARLYYRVVTSSTPAPLWNDVHFSTSEHQSDDAPWIKLLDNRQRREEDSGIAFLELDQLHKKEKALWRT